MRLGRGGRDWDSRLEARSADENGHLNKVFLVFRKITGARAPDSENSRPNSGFRQLTDLDARLAEDCWQMTAMAATKRRRRAKPFRTLSSSFAAGAKVPDFRRRPAKAERRRTTTFAVATVLAYTSATPATTSGPPGANRGTPPIKSHAAATSSRRMAISRGFPATTGGIRRISGGRRFISGRRPRANSRTSRRNGCVSRPTRLAPETNWLPGPHNWLPWPGYR